MSEREQAWSQIEQLSQTLLELAKESKWGDLEWTGNRRREQLEAFFATEVDDALKPKVIEGIKNIQNIDDEVVSLVQQSSAELQKSLLSLAKGKKAKKAYQQNL